MNKKILAIFLALLMVVVSGVAMAEPTQSQEEKSFNITKTYEATSGTKPAQTFEFVVTNDETQQKYPLTISDGGKITFNATEGEDTSKSVTVTVPNVGTNGYPATPGVTYNYVITEKTNNIQGIAEDTTQYNVKVTVFNEPDENGNPVYKTAIAVRKSGSNDKQSNDGITFSNPYSAGALTVTKKLAGNLADMSDKFSIKVTFSPESGKSLTSTVSTSVTKADESNTVSVSEVTKTTEGNYEFTISNIGHNDVVTFNNVPAGASWKVEETDSKDYTASYTQQTGSIAALTTTNTSPNAAVVINTMTGQIDTGVTTDTMPYILLMAIVAAAAVVFLMKKRTVNE
ncbi:MAG: FctA domain-containing protein [Clostridia bacterium]|nr:FctA domain-containing protein [Clostridia bacterium]